MISISDWLFQACWTKRADWLAERDMFIEAQQAFHQAGKIEEALTVLEKLTSCAVTENRYNDAAHYYFLLSRQCSELAQGDKKKYYLEVSYSTLCESLLIFFSARSKTPITVRVLLCVQLCTSLR